MIAALWLLAGLGCSGGENQYILEGTVLAVQGDQVLVDHQAVAGLGMEAMTMPFAVHDPAVLAGVEPGDHIVARLELEQDGPYLSRVRVTGKGALPPAPAGPAPKHTGEVFTRRDVPLADGGTMVLGAGQGVPVALAFLYTRCPMPEYCPMTVARLQGLQEAIGHDARILAVTIDPEHDTVDVLRDFAAKSGADPAVWSFGRLEGDALRELAMEAALTISPESGEITHSLRFLVLDREGRVVERYDDNRWPLDRVVQQLRTGGPSAPLGMDGTVSP